MLKGDAESFEQALELMFDAMDGPLPAGEQAALRDHRHADQQVVLGTWARCSTPPPPSSTPPSRRWRCGITVPYLSLHGIDPGPDYGDVAARRSCPPRRWRCGPTSGHYLHLVEPARFLARLAEFEAQVRG